MFNASVSVNCNPETYHSYSTHVLWVHRNPAYHSYSMHVLLLYCDCFVRFVPERGNIFFNYSHAYLFIKTYYSRAYYYQSVLFSRLFSRLSFNYFQNTTHAYSAFSRRTVSPCPACRIIRTADVFVWQSLSHSQMSVITISFAFSTLG